MAVVAASAAAGLVTALEAATFIVFPALDPAGPTEGFPPGLLIPVAFYGFLCWLVGLAVLGVPLGLALRRIGRDGYVSAMLAGSIGGAVALLIGQIVMVGIQPPTTMIAYPALMLLPGAVAGWIARRVAYRQ